MELPNEVADVFDSYPTWARRLLKRIRKIAETVAKEQYGCAVEETLKWGEPSYLVHGWEFRSTSVGREASRYDWRLLQLQ